MPGEEPRALLAAIVDASSDAIISETLDGTITSWNRSAERLYGYSADEAIGRSIAMLIPPERSDELPSLLKRIARGERVEPYETRRVRKDGKRIVVRLSVSPILSQTGCIIGAAAIAQRDERWSTALQNIGEAVLTTDARNRVTSLNPVAAQLTGWSQADALERDGSEIFRIVNEMTRVAGENPAERVLRDGQAVGLTKHSALIARDGTERPIHYSAAPVLNDEGMVSGVVLVFRDITQRRSQEASLKASEERFEEIFNTMTEGLAYCEIICDEQGRPCDMRYLQVNASFERQTGLKASQAVGRTVREVLPWLDHAWFEVYGKVALTGEPAHFETELGDLPRHFEVSAFRTGPGRFAVLTFDITERKEAQEALNESEERFRSLFTAMSEGFCLHEILLDANGVPYDTRYVDINPAYEELVGIRREDVIGKTLSQVRPGDAPMLFKRYAEVALTGRSAHIENVSRVPGKYFDILAYRPSPGFVAVAMRDVTERKRAERGAIDLNTRLQRSMAETHHRVNESLHLLSTLIETQATAGEEGIPGGTVRALALHIDGLAVLHDLLAEQSRAGRSADMLSLRAVLGRLLLLLQATFAERQIGAHIEDAKISTSRAAALILLVNELVSNAAKHGSGDVTVSVSAAGGAAQLIVEDDGPGLSADFDPAEAASQGLELVMKLARVDLGGALAFENRPEGGARVTVRFGLT